MANSSYGNLANFRQEIAVLQETINKYGHDVKIIDFQPDAIAKGYKIWTVDKFIHPRRLAVTIKNYKSYINLPVFFDWEWGGRLSASKASKLGKTKCTEICNAFCKVIKDAGYDTGVYASLSVFNGYLNPSSIDDKYLIWVAQYNNTCSYTRKKYMWQYSSSGSVKGLSGRIDMNYLYGDTPTPSPAPQPITPGNIKVDGIWGADTTRKIQEKFRKK